MKLCNREWTPNTGTDYNHPTKWHKFPYRNFTQLISKSYISTNTKQKCQQQKNAHNYPNTTCTTMALEKQGFI